MSTSFSVSSYLIYGGRKAVRSPEAFPCHVCHDDVDDAEKRNKGAEEEEESQSDRHRPSGEEQAYRSSRQTIEVRKKGSPCLKKGPITAYPEYLAKLIYRPKKNLPKDLPK